MPRVNCALFKNQKFSILSFANSDQGSLIITNALWHVTNDALHRDLKTSNIKETIKEASRLTFVIRHEFFSTLYMNLCYLD